MTEQRSDLQGKKKKADTKTWNYVARKDYKQEGGTEKLPFQF